MYGLRSIPVHGMIYAFDRASGKAQWWHKAENQMLLMDRFNELPMLMLTSRYHKRLGRFGGAEQAVPFKSIYKRTGKLLMDEELPPNSNQFYALNIDAKAGRIELVSYNLKIVHEVRDDSRRGK